MAKKSKIQKSEKLGDIVGRRRPVWGAIFLFLGIIFLTAVMDFKTGQEIFWRDSFLSDFVPSTKSIGPNLCGKIGATFCVASLYLIGAATWIIPVYMLWTGWLCFKRRPSVLDAASGFAMLLSIVALSAVGAMAQRILDAPMVTDYFLSGRGGRLGELIFTDLLYPSIDIFGSAVLLVCVCLFCMIIIFIENPADTAAELGNTVRQAPKFLPSFFSRLWFGLSYLPRKIFGLLGLIKIRRAPRVVEVDTADKLLSPNGVEMVNVDAIAPVSPKEAAFAREADASNPNAQNAYGATEERNSNAFSNLEDGGLSAQATDENMDDASQFVYVPRGTKRDRIPEDFLSENEEPLDNSDSRENSLDAVAGNSPHAVADNDACSQSAEDNSEDLTQDSEDFSSPSELAGMRSLKEVAAILGKDMPSSGAKSETAANPEASTQIGEERGGSLAGQSAESENLPDGANGDARLAARQRKLAADKVQPEGLKIIRTEVEVLRNEDDAKPKKKGNYEFPPLSLLAQAPQNDNVEEEDYEGRMEEIIKTFETFKIKVSRASVSPGPVVTLYEVYPAPGVKVNKISNMEDDLALALRAMKVRIIAPVPGKGTVGIEVPNLRRETVFMRDVVLSRAWAETKAVLPVVIGKDVTGNPKVLDLAKMPHALVAGTTGSGKSVCINAMITSLLYRFTPDDLRLIMVDPKVVELKVYNDLPHMLIPVVTDPRKVPAALKWLMGEMERRYNVFAAANVRNIAEFNAQIMKDKEAQDRAAELSGDMTPEERAAALEAENSADSGQVEVPQKKIPYIVCIIDELSDLMLIAGKEVEAAIMRITALARAAGIHLLVATQRPSADVVTGVIKANLPTRIGFKVSSQIDSRTILDSKGAESLLGMGDMLFVPPGTSDLVRAQGVFLSGDETRNIVDFLKTHNGEPEFLSEIEDQMNASIQDDSGADDDDSSGDSSDEAFVKKAMDAIKRSGKASTSNLQRRLGIGYNKAARIMDILEERGYVGPDNGPGRPREIFF